MPINDGLRRFAAHLPLAGVGEAGQNNIGKARVAIIGMGGLGCAAAQYLVSSGVGHLTLCDFDTVAESNLSRQILYRTADIGRLKVDTAKDTLQSLNVSTQFQLLNKRMRDDDMMSLFPETDIVIDASDNYGTRLAVNRAAISNKTPWLMTSCIRFEGQLLLSQPHTPDEPCYRCVYGNAPDQLEDCPGAGIFAPVAGIMGASAAHFALSYVAGLPVAKGLHVFDGRDWVWQTLRIRKNPDCQDCSL